MKKIRLKPANLFAISNSLASDEMAILYQIFFREMILIRMMNFPDSSKVFFFIFAES